MKAIRITQGNTKKEECVRVTCNERVEGLFSHVPRLQRVLERHIKQKVSNRVAFEVQVVPCVSRLGQAYTLRARIGVHTATQAVDPETSFADFVHHRVAIRVRRVMSVAVTGHVGGTLDQGRKVAHGEEGGVLQEGLGIDALDGGVGAGGAVSVEVVKPLVKQITISYF